MPDLQVQTRKLISGEGQPSGNFAKSNVGRTHDVLTSGIVLTSQTIIALFCLIM